MSFKDTSCRLLLQYSDSVIESLRVVNVLQDVRLSAKAKERIRSGLQWKYVPGFGTAAVDALTVKVSAHWSTLPEADPKRAAMWRIRWKNTATNWVDVEKNFR